MKAIRGMAMLAVSVGFALALVGCGAGAGASSGASGSDDASSSLVDSSDAMSSAQPLSEASGSAVELNEANPAATVEVVVEEGEGLYILANFEVNEGEATAVVTQDGEEKYTDYFYDGYGCSETDVDPGAYTVKLDGAGATGTMWVLAYPAEVLDGTEADAEEAVKKILASAA